MKIPDHPSDTSFRLSGLFVAYITLSFLQLLLHTAQFTLFNLYYPSANNQQPVRLAGVRKSDREVERGERCRGSSVIYSKEKNS